MAAQDGGTGEVGFIDSHAHLADAAFDGDRDEVIARARSAGAQAIICIGESADAARAASRIAENNARFVFHTAGVHPHDAASFDKARDVELISEQLNRGAVAIGECGLDYHYDNSPQDAQRVVFAAQIELASRTSKPLVVHTRDAEDDTAAMIADAAASKVIGVLHCYTGSRSLAERAVDAGWYISFSGIVTFRKWTDEALLRFVPRDRLLVESDSPYLAPVPNRGRRNEPSWVRETLTRLAGARSVDPSTLGWETAANTRRLFALPAV